MTSPDRTVAPAPGPLRSFDFPAVESSALENGVALDVVRLPRLPVVTAYLSLPAGEEALQSERAGLATLTGEALEGGTSKRGGAELAEALEALGADVDVHSGWAATTISLSCLAERLGEGLSLLSEMVREPGFPEAEVERARAQQLARIRQQRMDPGSLATYRAHREIYADGEPYARPALGREATVAPVGVEALRGWAEAFLHAGGASLTVAGDVDADEVHRLASQALGDWRARPVERSVPAGRSRGGGRRIVVVDLPNAVQSEIRVSQVGVPRNAPERAALTVGNAILGGTFNSRLNLNLREENGFTYGVRSRFAGRRGPGPFSISTAVDTENTPAALREIFHEVERILEGGPTAEETEATRDYLAGVFPLRLESTSQVASKVAEQRIYELPADEWTGYRDRIRDVTPEAAHTALRDRLRPDELVVVISGNAGELRPGLEALGVGPVEVTDRESAVDDVAEPTG